MKKAVIIALVAVGSSLAVYAGVSGTSVHAKDAQVECCDKSECCPDGSSEDCCENDCE